MTVTQLIIALFASLLMGFIGSLIFNMALHDEPRNKLRMLLAGMFVLAIPVFWCVVLLTGSK